MLLDGEIDAAILGDVAEEGPLKHLIPDHEAEGRAWARAHGGVPINHLAVMRESIVEVAPRRGARSLSRAEGKSRGRGAPDGRGRPASLRHRARSADRSTRSSPTRFNSV